MKQRKYILLAIVLNSYVAYSQIKSDATRCVDLSLNGIHFCDTISTVAVLGKNIEMIISHNNLGDSGNDNSVEIQFYNANRTEVLTIYGSTKYSFFRFTLTDVKKSSNKVKVLKKISSFISGKHIHLGMSMKSVLGIMGNDCTKKSEGSFEIYDYDVHIENYPDIENNCGWPGYSGHYKFYKNKLVEYSFGYYI